MLDYTPRSTLMDFVFIAGFALCYALMLGFAAACARLGGRA